MTLREKTLVIIGVTLMGLLVVLLVAARQIVYRSFNQLEIEAADENLSRVTEAIAVAEREVRSTASDYAAWDDTCDYIQEPYESYETSNYSWASIQGIYVNTVIYLDREDNPVFMTEYDLSNGMKLQGEPPLLRALQSYPGLLNHTDVSGGQSGLVRTDGGVMLVSAEPIVTSRREGPILGTVLMGRYVDEEEIGRLASVTRLDLRMDVWSDAPAGPEFASAREQLSMTNLRHFDPMSTSSLAAYVLISDFKEDPVLIVRADMPRQIMGLGRSTIFTFIGVMLAGGIMCGLASLLLLERLVLRRMARLSRTVRTIGLRGDLSTRVPEDGADEIGDLAKSINETLEALERAQEALRSVGSRARCILWSADVEQGTDGDLQVSLKMQDERAAQRLLPMDLYGGVSYADSWKSAIHPEDKARVAKAPIDAIRRAETSYEQEYRIRTADDDVQWVGEQVAIEHLGGGRWRLVGVCTEITDRKQAQEELQRARDAALEVAQIKSDFLANMSHEVRTPINGIVGMVDLLKRTELAPEQQEYVQLIRVSADSLMTVINDILDFSKIESGKLRMEAIEFPIRGRVRDLVAIMAVRGEEKGIAVVGQVDDDVPDTLVGDPGRLTQVLMNLVGNAVKFTSEGEVRVVVGVEQADSNIVTLKFAVRDTGIGIPADKLEQIFEPFVQADASTTRRFGGTGLGLAICREIVQLMHGQLAVESVVDEGSTFSFTAEFRRGEGRRPTESGAVEAVSRPLRILLAEDNPINRRVARRLLEQDGHRIFTVEDGLSAVQAIEHERYDLVLMDVHMPRMGGFEALGAIRASERIRGGHIPVIAMTARAMEGDRERCLEAGMDGYIAKPVEPRLLRREIRRVVGDSQTSTGETAPAESAAQDAVLDLDGARERCGGDDLLLAELLDLLRESADNYVARIRLSAQETNWDEMIQVAHTLKGAAANLCAREVAAAARSLEETPPEVLESEHEGLVAQLDLAIERLKGSIDSLLRKKNADIDR